MEKDIFPVHEPPWTLRYQSTQIGPKQHTQPVIRFDTMASTMVMTMPSRLDKNLKWTAPKTMQLPDTPPDTPPCEPLQRDGDYLGDLGLPTTSALETHTQPIVAVIGTGYVGLHLVEAFSSAYEVVAFDVSDRRLQEIRPTLPNNVTCTSDPTRLSRATHFLISVSTVIDSQQNIDTSCIRKAIQTIEQHARPGSTIVIESSVAVGMTRDLLRPLMVSKSLKCGMSPEVCLASLKLLNIVI